MVRAAFLLLLALITNASPALAQQYNFKRFSVEDGLPRSGVYCILQDSRGYLWVGTEGGGLARYDGQTFETYTISSGLPHNTIRALFEDKEGNLWIGTNGAGLCKYDGHAFETFSTENGLSNNYIRSITQATDSAIWIGTYGGGINKLAFEADSLYVTIYDQSNGLKSDNVRAALSHSSGQLWFGTDKGLASTTDGSSWKLTTTAEGLSHNRILDLYEDQQSNVWIGTKSGVNCLSDTSITIFTEADGLIDKRIRGICQDNAGNIWFGTQAGVTRYNGTSFTSFTEANGLSNNRIRHIEKDRSGNLWFGTYFGGICRFSGEEFIHFTEKDGLESNQVLSVFSTDSNITWLGTLEGLTALRPNADGTWTVMQNELTNALKNRSVNTIVKTPSNDVWFGTDQGILVYTGQTMWWLATDKLPFTENVKAILFENPKYVWIGSDQGATRFEHTENGYIFNEYHSNSSINESEVSTIFNDNAGRIWICYLNAVPVIFQAGDFRQPPLPQGLTKVSAMLAHSDQFCWIGTQGNGIFKYEPPTATIATTNFTQIGLEDGLSSMDIHQLLLDSAGNLWAGSATGIDQIKLNQASEIQAVHHFGIAEGFVGIETNENACAMAIDGGLWFGTIGGATRYNPHVASFPQVENKLHITAVNLEFESVNWHTHSYSDSIAGYFRLPHNLQLPYSENNLTIEYNAINLRTPHQVVYQWKLDGFNDEWSQVERKNAHSFTNLSPGFYTFKVRSANGYGVWNQEPATFSFRVLAPFWMTWWFITLCIAALLALLFLIIKIREKRHLAEKLKLQSMVDARTKELRQEKERSDQLLLNILPLETAEELKTNGYASVQQYDMVSVLFTDFVGFTTITEGISNEELVRSLDEHFRLFDDVMDKFQIEKIKTIGDAYMAAGGIPTRTITNPLAVVAAGLEMIYLLHQRNQEKEQNGQTAWKLRLGIHTGNVISGVVGKNKFAFDIWGDAVNTAARMESSGEVMKVNISKATYNLVKDHFECTPRGKIKAKNKGEIEMYFVNRLKPEYSADKDGFRANEVFLKLIERKKKVT